MNRPRIVQHSFGAPGSGGPIGVLGRLIDSPMSEKYEFIRLHQSAPFRGIDYATILSWASRLRDADAEMIHVRGLGNEGFHAVAAARLAGLSRILVSIHGSQRDLATSRGLDRARKQVVAHGLEPLTLAGATHLATVCRFAANRRFVRRHRRKLVGVVPNGVPVTTGLHVTGDRIRTEFDIPKSALVLAYVGRLSPEKGLSDFAAALRNIPSRIGDRPLHVVIVGSGPARAQLELEFTRSTGAQAHFVGTRHDVPNILDATDLFVFPTLHENLSNALLEAMSRGVPVVATSVGGNTEVLEGGAGVLVPPSSPRQLGRAISNLLSNQSERSRLSRAGLTRVKDKYSLEAMLHGWDLVYQRTLSR